MTTPRVLVALTLALLAAFSPSTAGFTSPAADTQDAPTCAQLRKIILALPRADLDVDCDGRDDQSDPAWQDNLEIIHRVTQHGHRYACYATECHVYTRAAPGLIHIDPGNQECTLEQQLLDDDTDGDGQKDCEDPDDDNDRLSDEVEAWAFETTSTRTRRDSDSDGIPDATDLRPRHVSGVRLNLAIIDYQGKGESCDQKVTAADPYLDTIRFLGVPGGATSLVSPPGWREDMQVNDRQSGSVTDGTFDPLTVSSALNNWDIAPWDIPKVRLTVLARDNDQFNFDEQIDLTFGPGVDVGNGAWPLTIDTSNPADSRIVMEGDADCRAALTFGLVDNIDWKTVLTEVYAFSTAGVTVEKDDVLKARYNY